MRRLIDVVEQVLSEKEMYHGTPHDFDKFALSKTDDGANIYGWGLYFTSKVSVARIYQNKLEVVRTNNRLVKFLTDADMTIYRAVDKLLDGHSDEQVLKELTGSALMKKSVLFVAKMLMKISKLGRIMVVEIPNSDYLVREDILTKQQDGVKEAVTKIAEDHDIELTQFMTGRDFYDILCSKMSARDASLMLRQHGVLGIWVKKGHEGGEIAVVFDPSDLKIISKMK